MYVYTKFFVDFFFCIQTKMFNFHKNNPCSYPQTWIQMLYYACQASSWQCHFVEKHYVNVLCMRMTSPFSQICIFGVYMEMITVSFSKTCTLKTSRVTHVTLVLWIGNETLHSFYASGMPIAWPSLNPYRITPIYWLMARRHLWRNPRLTRLRGCLAGRRPATGSPNHSGGRARGLGAAARGLLSGERLLPRHRGGGSWIVPCSPRHELLESSRLRFGWAEFIYYSANRLPK